MRCEFEFLVGRSLFHLRAQTLDEVIFPAFQKEPHILHRLLVLLICCISFNARPHTAVNVILQARSRAFAVDLNIAVTNQEVSFDQLQTLPRKSRGKKRSKIQSPILADAPRDHGSREGLVYSELYIRIGFVVAQQNVVFGLVLLDEVVFQGECFAFGVGHDELDVFDCVHHLVLALVEIARQLEIGSYAVPQRFGFSHVNRLIRSILIEVHAGPGRNTIEFGFKNGVHGSSWDCRRCPLPLGEGRTFRNFKSLNY